MGAEETAPTMKTPITKEFLEKILKKKVIDFKVSSGSNPGDNFTSVLISLEIVTADDIDQPLYLLFKTFPSHPTRQKFLEEINLFLKEYQVYNIWLPELIEFQKKILGKNKDEILVPAMPGFVAGAAIDYKNGNPNDWKDKDPMLSNFILMVDVRKTFGYKMTSKLKSLDYHHAKVVLDEIAKYHALGHACKIHNKLPSILSKFPFMGDIFFCDPNQREGLKAIIKVNLDMIIEACDGFLTKRPDISGALEKYNDHGMSVDYFNWFLDPNGMDEEKVEGWMRLKPQQFSGKPIKDQWIIAGHGDCWTNNMLFKYDENGRVNSAILVDLQVVRESCIMTDLTYFIFTSTDTEFRKNYLDDMLKWYFDRFSHYCEILKVDTFPGFTLENFMRKFHRSKIIGFLFAAIALPLILQRAETSVNLDDLNLEHAGSENQTDEWMEMMKKMGRDENDKKLLSDRFSKLLEELYEQGVL